MALLLPAPLMMASATLAAAAAPPNLVKNPGFEIDADRDGIPDNWTPASPSDVLRPTFTRTNAEVRTGAYAACLRSPGRYRFGYLYQDIPVYGPKAFQLTHHYRTHLCRGGPESPDQRTVGERHTVNITVRRAKEHATAVNCGCGVHASAGSE